uniref:Uncharacterized protein n=1 Tax=Arundo donax TaxID=35708 RepID=A0A0A9B782_ARUDO
MGRPFSPVPRYLCSFMLQILPSSRISP